MRQIKAIIKHICDTILEALFPISEEERELREMDVKESFDKIPKAERSPIPDTLGIFSYQDEYTKTLIHCIKYKKSDFAINIGGYALSVILREMKGVIIVTPIPITRRRRMGRGYNQCELLIRSARKYLEDESNNQNGQTFIFVNDLLIKNKNHGEQKTKDRKGRLESAGGIFTINQKKLSKLKDGIDGFKIANETPVLNSQNPEINIIIIDDVITTGSTIHEAMEVLKMSELGKIHIYGLALAH